MEGRKWATDVEFLLHCMIPSIGLSTLWRFPYMMYANGGGAFWYAYLIVSITIGAPIYYLQLALGQFSSSPNVYLFSQLGVGYTGIAASQTFSAICTILYYSALVVYVLMYVANSAIHLDLPWVTCDEANLQCVSLEDDLESNPYNNYSISTEVFFKKMTQLNMSTPFGIFPKWELCVCLLVSTILINVYVNCNIRMGRCSHLAVLVLLICKLVMCGLASSLKNGTTGIYGFFLPDLSQLLNLKVWYDAVTQCFFSMGVGFGTVLTCAAHSPFHGNVKRIALVTVMLDCLGCGLESIAVCGILGHLSYVLKVDITKLFDHQNIGIAFILYPIALEQFRRFSSLVCTIFFTMFYAVSLLSMVALYEIPVTFVSYWYGRFPIWKITLVCTWTFSILSLVLISMKGNNLIVLLNNHCLTLLLTFTNVCELLAFTYGYGLENICLDIQYMQKAKVGIYWRLTWFTIPFMLIIVFFKGLLKDVIMSLYVMHVWIILLGILQAPAWALYYCYKVKNLGFRQMIGEVFNRHTFGPKDRETNEAWVIFKEVEYHRREKGILPFFQFIFGK